MATENPEGSPPEKTTDRPDDISAAGADDISWDTGQIGPYGSYDPPKIKDVPGDQPLALADLDGTLTKPGDRLLIEKFVADVQVGSLAVREKLLNCFRVWREDRKSGNYDYEQYLTDIGDFWAQMLRDKDRPDIMERSEKWFGLTGKKLLMDYSPELIEELQRRKIRPIMITGAACEIAHMFSKDLGIDNYFAMEAEVDSIGKYTGEIKHNTGLNRAKVRVRDKLSGNGHKIIFGIGDTASDVPLFRGAIEVQHPEDHRGMAVLINPRDEIEKGAEFWLREWTDTEKLVIVKQHRSKEAVLRRIRHVLNDTLRINELADGVMRR